MQRIKSVLASALLAVMVFAGFGFGIMAVGFAILLGGVFALALRLAGPGIIAAAEKRAKAAQSERFEDRPVTA
ncbi:hypothetical protein Q4577_04140 [Marinovum sp. 2_MG-2023]|uniref:hypothetical protein n=1 Tax=Roseobacteraceae TaxID=2854170 RepID=UPI001FD2F555|nr:MULTISPECIES: hypothetical protein [Roseobacteraceae]MCJ7873283.1 hypothetical protein [Phaeobacter sp. J2-8]MDO6729196.1 hypothetical protein [Marinovum sp. 2_MG-2023]MDO6779177.1 hypothetical protein [Marinovum sp. 1_MG-2023]